MNKLYLNIKTFTLKIHNLIPTSLVKYFSGLIYLYILCAMIFARPFVGLNIFGFLIGEITIGLALIFSALFLITYSDFFSDFDIKIVRIFKIIFILFLVSSFVSGSNLANLYTYKTSSYIWTFIILFLAYFLLTKYQFTKTVKLASIFVLPYIYLISTGNYPNIVIDFFNKYSDKFQFIKASDLALSLFVVLLYVNKKYRDEKFKIIFSLFSISAFVPVMLFNSRGSIISLIIFAIYFLRYEYKMLIKNKLFTLVVLLASVAVFFGSTYRVYGNFDFYKEPESFQVENITEAVKGIAKNKDTAKVFLSFYVQDGYLMSWDPTTDWRLDIWQDVFYDLKEKNRLLTGYGYKEIIPVMLDPTAPGRLGRDGLNENVHNYFVNILARGGLLQVFMFLFLYLSIIKFYKKRHNDYKIFMLLIPVLILSSLDVTMEGVQFPFIFFTYLGYSLREGI